jgi:hypothetical protein
MGIEKKSMSTSWTLLQEESRDSVYGNRRFKPLRGRDYLFLVYRSPIDRLHLMVWDTSQKAGIWHFWYSFAKNAKFSDSMTSSPKLGSLKSGSRF